MHILLNTLLQYTLQNSNYFPNYIFNMGILPYLSYSYIDQCSFCNFALHNNNNNNNNGSNCVALNVDFAKYATRYNVVHDTNEIKEWNH